MARGGQEGWRQVTAAIERLGNELKNAREAGGGAPAQGGVDPQAAAEAAQVAAESADRQADAAQRAVDASSTLLENNEAQKNLADQTLAQQEAWAKAREEFARAEGEWTLAEAQAQQTMIDAARAAHKTREKELAEEKTALEKIRDIRKDSLEATKKGGQDAIHSLGKMVGLSSEFKTSMVGGWVTLAQEISAIDESTEEGKKAADALRESWSKMIDPLNIVASLQSKVWESTLLMVKAFDSTTASFNKSTGAAGKYNDEIASANLGAAHLGVSTEEMGQAYGNLFDNMSNFTEMTADSRLELGTMVGALESVGIAGATSASNLEFLTKVQGMGATAAAQNQKELAEFSKNLGVSASKMAENYKAAQPIMVKYGKVVGDQMFEKLARTAKATGIEMQNLLAISGQFDTFEGAATAAGKLNALLGGPMLNSVELLTANEADRIEMLRQGVQQSGRSWGSMNRFEQQAIASAAGISDMTEAAKLFGTTNEEFEANAEAQAELAEMSAKAQTMQEKMNKLMMQFSATIAPVVNKISELLTWTIKTIDGFGTFGKTIMTLIFAMTLLTSAVAAYTIAQKLGILANMKAIIVKTADLILMGLLKTAIVGYTIATGIWTGIQWLANSATWAAVAAQWALLAPILATILPIVALIAVVALLIIYWDELSVWIGEITGGMFDMWDVLILLTSALWWPLAPIILMIKYWDELNMWLGEVTGGFVDMWDIVLLGVAMVMPPIGLFILAAKLLYENWDDVLSGISIMFDDFGAKISQTWSLFTSAPKEAMNMLIKMWNETLGSFSFKFPAWMPLLGGETFAVPKIPMLADGGVTTSQGSVLVGEKGPELLDLPAGSKVSPIKEATATKGAAAAGAGPTTVILQLNEREFARAVIKVMDEKLKLSTG